MSEEIITVKTYYYLPWRGVWAIFLAGGACFLLLSGHYVLPFVFLALAVLVLTSHYGIRINLKSKTYTDFLSTLGFVNGEEKSFTSIGAIMILSSKQTKTMNSMVTSRSFTDDYFDGYIKFDEEKIYLLSDKKKSRVIKTVNELSTQLGIPVTDYSKDEEL